MKLKGLRELKKLGGEEVGEVPFNEIQGEAELKLPTNLTVLSYQELGRLYSQLTAHLCHLNSKMSEQRYEAKMAKIRFINARSQALVINTAAIKAKLFAKVNLLPEIKNGRQEVLVKETKVEIVQSMVWSLKGYLEAIKFETERRRCNVQNETRD